MPNNAAAAHLHEPVPESSGERLPTPVRSWGILGGKEPEVRVRFDGLLCLGKVKLSIVIQESVEGLKHLPYHIGLHVHQRSNGRKY